MTTLDTLIARHGTPAFIKIDVEGFEAEALAGTDAAGQGAVVRVHDHPARRGASPASSAARRSDYAQFNAALGESQSLSANARCRRQEIARWLDGAAARRPIPATSMPMRNWAVVLAIAIAGYALTLYVFFPGVMTYDAKYIYIATKAAQPGDWQSPVMVAIWKWIDPLAPGAASMFLLTSRSTGSPSACSHSHSRRARR